LWYNFHFFLRLVAKEDDPPISIGGDRESVLAEDPEAGTCSFSLSELGPVPAHP
jgi:hypothetical protein